MLQYIKKDTLGNLATPIQVTTNEKSAIQLWGEDNYVLKDIPDDLPLSRINAVLDVHGNVQPCPVKTAEATAEEKHRKDQETRAAWWLNEKIQLANNIRNQVPFSDWPIVQQLMSNSITPTDEDWKNHNPLYVIESDA